MEKIKNYVEELFQEAPRTSQAREFKEEMIADLEDKYQDLIKEGKSEKEAFQEIISGIGNIEELFSNMKQNHQSDPMNNEMMLKQRKKTALVVSLSVGLYIVALIVCIFLDELGASDAWTATSLFGISAIATCILIYHFMSQPKYEKISDTMIEEFKEWKGQKNQMIEMKKSIHSIIWTLVVIVYFLISFFYGIWYISWIIFIIGALVQNIVDLLLSMKGEK